MSDIFHFACPIIITIKKAFEPIVQIANLEKMGVKFQKSNFLHWVKTLANSMNKQENVLIIEKFLALKSEIESVA